MFPGQSKVWSTKPPLADGLQNGECRRDFKNFALVTRGLLRDGNRKLPCRHCRRIADKWTPTRKKWLAEPERNRTRELDAPTWLWTDALTIGNIFQRQGLSHSSTMEKWK
jgi:hypothetical protein